MYFSMPLAELLKVLYFAEMKDNIFASEEQMLTNRINMLGKLAVQEQEGQKSSSCF